jgi:geranylgeranylglycerol-phosphate geranylgeranyltransferase
MNSIKPWFRIFRPLNSILAGAGVWLGWFSMRASRPEAALAIWGCASMMLLAMAGNADNDVLDLTVDRINRPQRPLPSGALAAAPVRTAAFLLYALGVVAAGVASSRHACLAGFMVLLLLIYNRKLKALPLIGNLAVSLLCGLAIYFPEFPSRLHHTLPAFAFAFLATWAREVVKDIEDLEGDRAAGLRTFPLVTSVNSARKLAFSLLAALLALLPMPVIYFGYRWPYALLSIVLAGPFLLVLLWELAGPSADFSRCQRHLKWMMVGGMIALLAGVVG